VFYRAMDAVSHARGRPGVRTDSDTDTTTEPGLLTILTKKSIAIINTNTKSKKYCQYQYQ